MTWVAVSIVGTSLLGGALQSSSSRSATSAQERSSNAAIAEQRAGREAFEQRTEPFRQIGLAAAPELARLLGISIPSQSSQDVSSIQNRIDQIDQEIAAGPQTRVNPSVPASIFPSVTPSWGTPGMPNIGAISALRDGVTETLPFDQQGLATERQSLVDQLNAIQSQQTAPQADQTGPPMLDEINPLVSFLRDEGFADIQETAAAQGRLRSGGTLKDLTRFNTNLASTIVPQLQNQRFNQLFSLLGLGSNAAAGQGTAALNTATNIGNLQVGQGSAAAQNALNQGQIAGNTISDLAGAFGYYRGSRTPPPPQGIFDYSNPGAT